MAAVGGDASTSGLQLAVALSTGEAFAVNTISGDSAAGFLRGIDGGLYRVGLIRHLARVWAHAGWASTEATQVRRRCVATL